MSIHVALHHVTEYRYDRPIQLEPQTARYVSGYLLTQPPEGQPRLMGADASPLRGVLQGGQSHTLKVGVSMEPVA